MTAIHVGHAAAHQKSALSVCVHAFSQTRSCLTVLNCNLRLSAILRRLLTRCHFAYLRKQTELMADAPTRILLYIADPIVAQVTSFRLRLRGITSFNASTMDQLDEQMDEALPDAFIVDLDAEDHGGLQIVEKLTSNEVTSRIPILCMSAEGDLPHAEEAFHAGAHQFLVVPYDPIVFERKVVEMIETAEAERRQLEQKTLATAR